MTAHNAEKPRPLLSGRDAACDNDVVTAWTHRLAEIDPEARTATCAACGRVGVKPANRRVDGSFGWRCVEAAKKWNGNHRHATITPAAKRKERLRRKFGITVEQYDAMLKAQGGVCALCGQECSTGRRLAVDHCHETGRVRALLCGRCNQGLGSFDDDPARLQQAAAYLERYA